MIRVRSLMASLMPFLLALASGCSTLSTPVLRHETAETLGTGKFRLIGHYEMSRIYPMADANSATAGVAQNSDVFNGGLLGVNGAGGLFNKFDVQLGAFLAVRGGGWRLGAKYEAYRTGYLTIAGMAGYSVGAGSGTVTLHNATGPIDSPQTLSGNTIDLGAPVSFRFSQYVALYGGLTYFHSEMGGAAGSVYAFQVFNDWSSNLGLRVTINRFEIDAESAILLFNDPFVDSTRLNLYYGVGVGILF